MSTKHAGHVEQAGPASETPILDEDALKMLEDHSCCGPVQPVQPEAESGTEGLSGAATQQQTRKQTDVQYRPEPAAASGQHHPGRAKGSDRKSTSRKSRQLAFRVRLTGFLAVCFLVLGTALWLVRPMDIGEQAADYTIDMSMSGFTPPSLNFPAGKAVTLKLVNTESPFHASGAAHQFAVDALGINEKLDAKQTRVITIPAQKPGTYTFYCDVCCGGQKSPTMRGTLTFQ
jgi:hypothetical protein